MNFSNSTVTINGATYSGSGSVQIKGCKVFIGGVEQTLPNTKEINIIVNGNIETLVVDCCKQISVSGDVENCKSSSGDIEVLGSVKSSCSTTSGDIKIKQKVEGNVTTTSGDVECENVGGSVKTVSGDIKYRK